MSVDDVDPGTPVPVADTLTSEERGYYAYAAPRLRSMAAEARFLADLGATRSRDLPEIQAHGESLTVLIAELVDYAESNGVPGRFEAAHRAFREGAGLATRAMRASREGLARFDFGQVATAVPVFEEGAARLEAAVSALESAGGSG